MSNSLALGAVSAVLQSMLQARLAADPVAGVMGDVTVSVLPPDRVPLSGAADPNQVNLFLHQVTRNPGWANVDLPARDTAGQRSASPPLVLDLHYLLTVYGATPLHSEILLGECMLALHEEAVPSRALIERALSPEAPPPGFPAALALSGLSGQIERIRIVPSTLSTDDLSRLWSATQARVRTTVAYQVTTVILDSTLPARRALPVAQRLVGASVAARPRLDAVAHADDPRHPVTAGAPLRLSGRDLAATDARVEIGGVDVSATVTRTGADEILLALPVPLPAGLRPGVAGVRVLHRRPLGDPPVAHDAAESNLLPLVIRPTVSAAFAAGDTEVLDGVTLRSGTLTLTFTSPLAGQQRVRLRLNRRDATAADDVALDLPAPDGLGLAPGVAETTTVPVPVRRVPAGAYLVRASVDGVESLLQADPLTGRYATPQVLL